MTDYNKSVFINCPFDESYRVLQQCMLFTIITLGYRPRIASESMDSGEIRLEKIISLIKESKYSIHDLSRIKSSKEDEYYRLNMPFELGIDFGCKRFTSEEKSGGKKFLILGEQKYEYMKALSDISGIDILYHNNDPIKLIKSIRDWFVTNSDARISLVPNKIWYMWTNFCYYYRERQLNKGYAESDLFEVPIKEQIDIIEEYLQSTN